MKLLPSIILLLLTALPTFARLGETKAECEARYGKPITVIPDTGTAIYQKAGFSIRIEYWKDKAARISFSKDNPDIPGFEIDGRPPLTPAERNTLLKANNANSAWKLDEGSTDELTTWTRSSDQAIALYSTEGNDLTFVDAAYGDHQLEELDKAKAEKLKVLPTLRESKAELEKRCGKPVETLPSGSLVYQAAGFKIAVDFWNDKAGRLMFQSTRLLKDPFSKTPGELAPEPLTDDVCQTLLKASVGNSTWEKDHGNSDSSVVHWNRADKKAYAIYHFNGSILSITDEEFYDYEKSKEEKEAAEKLKDFGGLGLTKTESEKHFGKPIHTLADGDVGYHKSGIGILATFWNEKAARVVFFKMDPDADEADEETREPISSAERDALLKANSNGSKWTEIEKDEPATTISWIRGDLKALAIYNLEEKTLQILDPAYQKHLEEEKKDKGAKDLEGF